MLRSGKRFLTASLRVLAYTLVHLATSKAWYGSFRRCRGFSESSRVTRDEEPAGVEIAHEIAAQMPEVRDSRRAPDSYGIC